MGMRSELGSRDCHKTCFFCFRQFLPALVDAGGDLDKIGRVFLIHQDSFEHYITFCGNKTKSEAVYSEFRPHMMEAMHALGQRLELSSYLILPIQRLTKCGLLLADILKYVNRLDRKSLPLEMAAVMLQDASTRSNNSIHYFELEGLAKKDLPLCDLDFQDLFWVKCDGVWKERRVFLFKTAIVLTKPLLHEGMGQSLVIQKVVEVSENVVYVCMCTYVSGCNLCVCVCVCVCVWIGSPHLVSSSPT